MLEVNLVMTVSPPHFFAGFGPTLNLWAIIEGACSDQGLVFCKQRLWNYGQLGKSSPLLAWFCK